jgi:hypothetical protein
MELDLPLDLFEGKEVRNQFEIFDALVFYLVGKITQVQVDEDGDDFLKLGIFLGEEKKEVVLFYIKDFAVVSLGDSQVYLKVDHFIQPFGRKVYKVSQSCPFRKYVNQSMVKRLFFILRRLFQKQIFVFEKLPKVLLAQIFVFLDVRSLSNLMVTCWDYKRCCDYQNLWRDLYYAKYGNCNFNLKNLNWREIYLKSS